LVPPIEATRPERVRLRNSYTLSPPVCGKTVIEKNVNRKAIFNLLDATKANIIFNGI